MKQFEEKSRVLQLEYLDGIDEHENARSSLWNRIGCFEITFFRCVVSYICICSFVGGLFVSSLSNGVEYIDGIFMAASAMTGTGLATVEMKDLSSHSLVAIYVLMLMGGTVVLLLPPMLYRRAVFLKLRPVLVKYLEEEGHSNRPTLLVLRAALTTGDQTNRAVGAIAAVIALYLVFWLVGGTAIMYAIVRSYDNDPAELRARGFGQLSTSAFLTVSCFCNCGFTLTSDSLLPYADQPGVYLWSPSIIPPVRLSVRLSVC